MQQQNSDGESGFPWAFAFDPAANVRALSNVQRRGLQAASQAVDGLLSSMDSRTDGPGRPAGEHDGSDADIRGLAALWAELVTRGMSEMLRLGRAQGTNGDSPFHADSEPRVWVDLGSGQSSGSVEVVSDGSGPARKPSEVWLFNRTSESRGPVSLHASELRSSQGVAIPSADVRFDPAVAELPGRSDRGIKVSLCGDNPHAPGVYRGIIQATGAPAVAITIELTVEES